MRIVVKKGVQYDIPRDSAIDRLGEIMDFFEDRIKGLQWGKRNCAVTPVIRAGVSTYKCTGEVWSPSGWYEVSLEYTPNEGKVVFESEGNAPLQRALVRIDLGGIVGRSVYEDGTELSTQSAPREADYNKGMREAVEYAEKELEERASEKVPATVALVGKQLFSETVGYTGLTVTGLDIATDPQNLHMVVDRIADALKLRFPIRDRSYRRGELKAAGAGQHGDEQCGLYIEGNRVSVSFGAMRQERKERISTLYDRVINAVSGSSQ